MYTQQDVLDFIQEEDVKFIRLAFFDLAGRQKNVSIMPNQLPRAFQDGISFDASSVAGFQTPDRSDLFLHPDPSTITIIPWRPTTGKVVRMFCDIRNPDGSPYRKDSRRILKDTVEQARRAGYEFQIGTEMEFYLFNLDEGGNPTKIPFDYAGYMDIAPDDRGENIRRDICFTLEQMGILPEASHHEEGPGQNEIDFHYADPLTTADNTATFKWIVRTKAVTNGLYADFSPKPLEGKPGNGMHINLSVKKAGQTTGVSDDEALLQYALAGILRHIEEITAYLNPVEDSYRRLGSAKAPAYISWGRENRSQLVRIPATKDSASLELRSPDAMANPYLAYALVIAAALDGIQ
ncbi:MAG: glutamine synthetase, partial [Treponema sp.]|nr:glutamine synthetase [Treponema sp.]